MFFLLSGVNFVQNALKASISMMSIFWDQKEAILDRKRVIIGSKTTRYGTKWIKLGMQVMKIEKSIDKNPILI